jgi:hypothetical protein
MQGCTRTVKGSAPKWREVRCARPPGDGFKLAVAVRDTTATMWAGFSMIWDNGTIHGGDAIREMVRTFPRLRRYRFPGYAPEVNPDEGVWQLAKCALASGRSDSQPELMRRLRTSPLICPDRC